MPSTSRRSRSPAFGRVSVHSSSDGNDDGTNSDSDNGTNSDSDVGSDVSTSSVSSTSSADTIQDFKLQSLPPEAKWFDASCEDLCATSTACFWLGAEACTSSRKLGFELLTILGCVF